MTTSDIVLKELQEEFGVIENIPSDIGYYNSRPIFVYDPNLNYTKNIHVARRERNGVSFLVRQWSPSYRQKDEQGYFYVVDYKIEE